MPQLPKQIIEAAINGFEAQKERIDAQIAELRGLLNGDKGPRLSEPKAGKRRRKMTPATLQRMRDGQQRRWAKVKGEPPAPKTAKKAKRRLSAAGRANIVAALKKRWAEKKKGA